MPSGSGRRQGDDDRRSEILQAAIRIIDRDGVRAATTRNITAEAGLPNGIFHYWFSGKQDLLEAVIRLTLTDLRTAAIGDGDGVARGTLLERFRAIFEVVKNDPPGRQLSSYELTALALRTPALRALAEEQYRNYRDTAAAALDGWDGPLVGPRETVAALLAVIIDGLILAWLADPEGTPVDAILELVASLLTPASNQPN